LVLAILKPHNELIDKKKAKKSTQKTDYIKLSAICVLLSAYLF